MKAYESGNLYASAVKERLFLFEKEMIWNAGSEFEQYWHQAVNCYEDLSLLQTSRIFYQDNE